jgi:hypothetical protein
VARRGANEPRGRHDSRHAGSPRVHRATLTPRQIRATSRAWRPTAR